MKYFSNSVRLPLKTFFVKKKREVVEMEKIPLLTRKITEQVEKKLKLYEALRQNKIIGR